MKDKHNVILILVSSSKFNSLFRRFIQKILGFNCSSFFFEVPSSLSYIIAKLHLNHCKASPCVFNFSFFSSSFYYRISSWRLYMMVRQGFLLISNCSSRFLLKLRSVKPYSKINMVLNSCFVLRSSSILHLAFQSAILSTLSFEVVLGHSWQFPFTFHDSQVFKSDIFKSIIFSLFKRSFQPSISSLELSWYRFHLKPSLRNVAICGAY